MKKGRCGTMTHDYKRNGTSTLFAALEVATGRVIGECYQKHTHKEFLKFMNFRILSERQLKRGIFSSVRELEERIISFIEKHNDDPVPFVWTKTAGEILEKVNRARVTLNKLQTV